MEFELMKIKKDEDYAFLYSLMKEEFPEFAKCYAIGDFVRILEDKLRRYYHEFFLVEAEGKTVGYIASYQYRYTDGICYLEFRIPETMPREAVINCFLEELHRHYPIRKVFAETADEKNPFLLCGFHEEAHLKEYRFHNGTYEDVLVYARNIG